MRKKKENLVKVLDIYEIQNKAFKDQIEGVRGRCTQRGFTEEQKKEIYSKIHSDNPVKKRYLISCLSKVLKNRVLTLSLKSLK